MTEPRKPRKASWRELPPAEMAAHLLATPTIGDGVWTSEPRLPRETRSDFVRRVLLGETPESEPETPEAAAAELAGLKRGYYLLNTDGGNSGDPLGRAAIGALLRTPRLVTVAQISKAIGPATHNVAEYQALIEGLKLARDYGIQRIRVYMDSELVVDQVNGVSAVRQAHLTELHKVASSLVAPVQEHPHQLGASGDERRGRPTREGCSSAPLISRAITGGVAPQLAPVKTRFHRRSRT
jgi:reverse transcriptase-like protein